jgi:hypothetical protein
VEHAPTHFTFIRLPSYMKAAAELFSDVEEREIERVLCEEPQAGSTIANAGGVAKLRVKLPGRGKSASARVIYLYRGSVGRIYLLYAYAKGEQETVSDDEKKVLRKLTAILEREK